MHPAIQAVLIQHVIVRKYLVVVLRRECVAVPVVVEIGGVGFAPVGQRSIWLRFAAAVLIPHTGKARQGRVCLMLDGRVVIVGKDGVVEHIIPRHPVHFARCHALILLMARQHLHIELIDPLAGNAPAHVGAVVEKAQKVHRARIAPLTDQLFGIEQIVVQHRIQALDGGVVFLLRVLHVVLAVPAGEIGVVAPLPLTQMLIRFVLAVVSSRRLDLAEHLLGGPQVQQIDAVGDSEFQIVEPIALGVIAAAVGIGAEGVGIRCARGLLDGGKLGHLAPVAALDVIQQALHVIDRIAVFLRARIVPRLIFKAEGSRAAAHHGIDRLVAGVCGRSDRVVGRDILLGVVEPQGVALAGIVDVHRGGAVALNGDVLIGTFIDGMAEKLRLAAFVVGVSVVLGKPADVGIRREPRCIAGDDLTGDGAALLAAHVVIFGARCVFQPVHHGVRGVGALPERYVAGVLRRNGGGQFVGLAVALAVLAQLVPAGEAVAVAGGGSGHKGRTIAGVDVLRAVAAVGIQLDLIVIAVVVALEHGGAVRRHRLGIVIELGEAARLLLVQPQRFIGDDGACQGAAPPVIVHVLRVHVVVNVLEVVADGIGHRNGLVVHVDGVGLPGVVRPHRQIQTLGADRSRVGVGGRRIIGVPIGRIAQIGGGQHLLAVRLAAFDRCGEAGVDGQPGHSVQIVDGDVDILRSAAAGCPARRASGRGSCRGRLLRQLVPLAVQSGGVRLHIVGDGDLDGVGGALAAHRAAHHGAALFQRGRHHGIRQRQRRGGGVVDVHPVAVQLYLPLIVRVARLAGGLHRDAAGLGQRHLRRFCPVHGDGDGVGRVAHHGQAAGQQLHKQHKPQQQRKQPPEAHGSVIGTFLHSASPPAQPLTRAHAVSAVSPPSRCTAAACTRMLSALGSFSSSVRVIFSDTFTAPPSISPASSAVLGASSR